MDQNNPSCTDVNAAIDLARRYSEPWLSIWRTNALLLVEPWDNAIRAFAERARSDKASCAASRRSPSSPILHACANTSGSEAC
jgi:hypothetical protein